MTTTKKKTTKKKPIKKTARQKPRKPEFEQALEQEAAAAQARQEQKEQELEDYIDPDKSRGAEDHVKPEVSKKEIHACGMVLKIPFGIWSNIKKIPEIRLSTQEAEEWAEPVVDLLEYYFPGRIPEIVLIWFCFLSSTAKVIDSRIEIVHQHKKTTAPQGPATTSPKHSREPAPSSKPKHEGAEPAEGYPKEG